MYVLRNNPSNNIYSIFPFLDKISNVFNPMKVNLLLIVAIILNIKLYAQKQISFIPSIGTGIDFVSSNGIMVSSDNYHFDTETNLGFNINASVLIEYSLNKHFALGIEPSYQYQKISFNGLYSNGAYIPENLIYRNHQIRSQLIRLPIVLKYTMNDYYLVGEYGISCVLYSNYTIERLSYWMDDPKDITVTPISSGLTKLTNNKSSFGHFFGLGFGRELKFWKKSFIIELKYNQDINEWLYTPDEPDFINEITFRNSSFYLFLGIKI